MIKNKLKTKKVTNWLDENLLPILSGILLVLVPLFPKIPLFSPIETYIVRVRPEDFLILFTFLVWAAQLIRKKIKWQSFLSWFIIAYLIASLLSVISSILVIKTVPLVSTHILKTTLHYFRYLEYFTLFFIFFSSLKKPQHLKIYLLIICLSLLGVVTYGYGQKYHYWPVYSTMNREFSKGIRLYLTEHARVQSTFAGHYDLAAYLVIVLPIVLSLAFSANRKITKWSLFVLHFLGVWLLIMSAARTSFIAYALATVVVTGLFGLRKKGFLQKSGWISSRLIGLWLVIIVIMANFGGDMYERFIQVVKPFPQLYAPYQQLETSAQKLATAVGEKFTKNPPKAPPANSISTKEAAVIVASDERPISERPSDVYDDIPDQIPTATVSAEGKTELIFVEKPRIWSDNALEYGLSAAIRLDTLWPRAIQGFIRNPLFGSGYATLNKTSLTDFTIADSTDNNYLRTLGETGLLGFITFYGTVLAGLFFAIKKVNHQDTLLRALSIGYVAATLGLLLNAFYIDVFAASKIALTFWSITGLLVGYDKLSK